MLKEYTNKYTPIADLSIIGMNGVEEITDAIDRYLLNWRSEEAKSRNIDTFKIKTKCPRFGTGEGKGIIFESVRGNDIFIISDVFNYGVTYKMYGKETMMSPDDHFQDLKRIIAAIGGKARRITVIMPMLYEGRQHGRQMRESLDCSLALQELVHMGVENIISFDVHDPKIQNAIPLSGFENFHPTYQMIKSFVSTEKDFESIKDNLIIVSPDAGGMGRCIYYSSVMGVDLGMFYKRRDYTRVVKGKNPVLSHEFLGTDLKDKNVIIIDDMISSGDSMIDAATKLKERGAKKVFVFAAFGLFNEGLDRFDKAQKDGIIERVYTTNLIYRTPELKTRSWYHEVDMSKYVASIIDVLNSDKSLSELLDPVQKIKAILSNSVDED
ncbi:ribose-phosphate pyrophosphokinase [Sedimentibacter sp. zth1]|uniref:ribose-phosphate pyrophosphokinase n=1 Tax=Sedimentibacter sp. zth1 TaxID=2816908 RepID=UPI001A937F01|nr:ribose-phosphate pyrophosphokinase [Sedimentibacter sp. zth1]QSX05369.1 ribose-phosphate pyrophosphokinase [Sedimentibacter sp. zth1]